MSAFLPLLDAVRDRVRPPVALVLGGSHLAAQLLDRLRERLAGRPAVCYQMDLFQADRLRDALGEADLPAEVVAAPDLWDLPADFQTVLYPAPKQGERALKIDLVEQAFHLLRPRGTLLVLSPHVGDDLFPKLVKKVFGRCGMVAQPTGTAFIGPRPDRESPRRRHEVRFHARLLEGEPALEFVSRPGVFAYGRLDDGTRALAERMRVGPGERVVDLGCGLGALGICAGRHAGPDGAVTFIDSNLRAVALAELNARHNGLTRFEAMAAKRLEGPPPGSFDVAVANPPYFAHDSIARLFVEGAARLLRPGGRFYLVTRQPHEVEAALAEHFGRAGTHLRRDYTIFEARR